MFKKGCVIPMNSNRKKRYVGLIGLYVLLLITSSLIRQIKYYGILAIILLVITIVMLVILWKYLLRNNVISVTWLSMTYELNPHKSERMFLFSIVTLVSPVLRFHDITINDLIISIISVLIGIIGYKLNERHLYIEKE